MAFVVEDGSGSSSANAYASVAYVTTYASDNGLSFSGTDAQKEQAIVRATSYIDSEFTFLGARTSSTQALEWPRTGVTDIASGVAIASNVVPLAVKKAVAELACKVRTDAEALLEDLSRGGMVKSETVGPISVTYMDGAPAGKVYAITKLLKGLVRPTDPSYAPLPPNAPGYENDSNFHVGQFNNPPTSSTED